MVGISVVIPVYNREKYLPELINTIKNQLTDNIEVIFVDDGSTDGSRKIIIDAFDKFNNVKLIRADHAGPGAARNKGLEHATKEYIWFVDSDDLIYNDVFDEILKYVQNDCDLFVFNYVVKSNGKEKEVKLFNKERELYKKNEIIKMLFRGEINNSVWNKLFKNTVIKENKISFPEDLTNGEDGIFLIRYLDKIKKDVQYIDKQFYIYIKNPNSLTSKLSYKIFESNNKIYHIKREYLLKYEDEEILRKFEKVWTRALLHNVIDVVNGSNSEEQIISGYKYLVDNKFIRQKIKNYKGRLHPSLLLIKKAVRFKSPSLIYFLVKKIKGCNKNKSL